MMRTSKFSRSNRTSYIEVEPMSLTSVYSGPIVDLDLLLDN